MSFGGKVCSGKQKNFTRPFFERNLLEMESSGVCSGYLIKMYVNAYLCCLTKFISSTDQPG